MTVKMMTLNLRVIAQLPTHGRLRRTSDGVLSIDRDVPFFTSLYRYVYNDSRTRAIKDVTCVVDEVEEKTFDWINSKLLNHPNNNIRQCLHNLANNIDQALIGVHTLRTTTYSQDPNVIGELDILSNRLQMATDRIKSVLELTPDKVLTDGST